MPIPSILEIVVGWIHKTPSTVIVRETDQSRQSVSKVLQKLRSLFTAWLEENSLQIGGPDSIVEVDESAFGKRKYNKGRRKRTRWVVGGNIISIISLAF